MSSKSNLVRRNGRYSVRVVVPNELRSKIGKREYWVSLETADLREANARKHAVLHRIRAELEDLRRSRRLTDEDLEGLARYYYKFSLDGDANARMAAGGSRSVVELHALTLPVFAGELRSHLATGETALVHEQARILLEMHGFNVEEGSYEFRKLCQCLLRVDQEVVKRKAERDAGDFTGAPKDPLLVQDDSGDEFVPGVDGKRPDALKPLSGLLTRFHAERSETKEKTRETQRIVVETFEEFLGHRKPISRITKHDVIDFKRVLLETPANRQLRFPNASIHDAIRQNKARPVPHGALSFKTINDVYLAHLKAIFNWAVGDGVILVSPATGVRVEAGRKKKRARYPFTSEEMRAIFSSGMYSPDAPREAKFWALLIAAYSGLRAGEIAQLEVSDSEEIQGTACFRITESDEDDETEAKSVKTGEAAHRVVPIHPELIRLGLLDRVAQARARSESRILWDWQPNPRGDYSQTIPKWFNRTYLPSVGITRARVAFHSFRHTFKDACRDAGIGRDVHDFLTAHALEGVSGSYGRGFGVKVLAQHLSRVRYELVDLRKLYIGAGAQQQVKK